jgi:UDP-N-acetylglucosamine acyltransferase
MISNSAYITPGAVIGKDVSIDPFAFIAANVVIGDGSWIGPGAVILDGARIGKNCKIFPSSVISGIPQDMKFKGEETTAHIGDNSTIREGVTVNRGTASAGKTVVGNNCLIMAYAHVGHDCLVGNNCIIGNGCGLAGEVVVDDWAILSGGVLVHQFSHIGGHVIIGGGSKVRSDVPPYIKADRDPLCYLGLNTVGLNRRNFGKERIDEIHNIYRIIYQSKRNTTQALEYVEKEFNPSPDRDYIIGFIRNSGRGIIRSPR